MMSIIQELNDYKDELLKLLFTEFGQKYEILKKPHSSYQAHVYNVEDNKNDWEDIDFPHYENKLYDIIVQCVFKLFNDNYCFYILHQIDVNELTNTVKKELYYYVNQILYEKEELLMNLSNNTYEGKECFGTFLFCSEECDLNKMKLFELYKPIDFEAQKTKLIRKLLETTSEDLYLCVQELYGKPKVIGLVSRENCNSGIIVKIDGINKLSIYDVSGKMKCKDINQHIYFESEGVSISEIDSTKICTYFNKIGIGNEKTALLFKYIKDMFINNPNYHGTILTFTDDMEFVERMYLNNRALKNKSELNLFSAYENDMQIDKQILMSVGNIDGAVVFNNLGDLQLFGAILDGKSVSKGDASKGSRFNSSKTFKDYYTKTRKDRNYLVISMSIDGGRIDVF